MPPTVEGHSDRGNAFEPRMRACRCSQAQPLLRGVGNSFRAFARHEGFSREAHNLGILPARACFPMIYRFKSRVTNDLIMLSAHADRLLRAIGKEPAPQGIVEVADLPAAIASIEQAVAEPGHDEPTTTADQQFSLDTVSLRQRAWPLLEMMRRAHKADSDIVWGV